MRTIIVLFITLLPMLARAGYTEGVEYIRLAQAQPTQNPDRIEVREAFWYGCPHCYRFEPELRQWLAHKPDDVDFVRLPAVFRPGWMLLARAYYTAVSLDVADKVNDGFFRRFNELKAPVRSLTAVKEVFLEAGVSGHEFDIAFNSLLVNAETERAFKAVDRYGLEDVPSMIVDGKYLTTLARAGGGQEMLEVVDYLVALERKARKTGLRGKASPATSR